MKFIYKHFLIIFASSLFVACVSSEKPRTPSQVTGHVGTFEASTTDKNFSSGVRITCGGQEENGLNYIFTAVSKKIAASELFKLNVVISSNQKNISKDFTDINLPHESLSNFKTMKAGIDYLLSNPTQFKFKNSEELIILNMKFNHLYKINPETNTFEYFDCKATDYKP